MSKQLSTMLIKQLIDLDFPFVKTERKGEILNSSVLRLNLKNKNQFHILDLFKLNSSLKQFIRILYLLKNPKVPTDFIIYIWCNNQYIRELIELFLVEYKLSKYFVLCDYFPLISLTETKDKQKFLFVLGDPWTEKPSQMLEARVLYNKIFLVSSLNFKQERPNLNLYKIQNDLSDYKKLLVLLVIIERIIGDPKNHNLKK